jgi:hypothetical protein
VKVQVTSPHAVVSPLSGFRAAALRVTFLRERTGREEAGTRTHYEPLFDAWLGGPIRVRTRDGKRMELPLEGARFEAASDPDDATPLGAAPEPFAAELERVPPEGALYYREHLVRTHDVLTLKAVVEPAPSRGGYREASTRAALDFVLRPDLGPITLVDELAT